MGLSENGKDGICGLVEGKLKNERVVDGLVFPKTLLPADPAKASSADDLVSFVTANREALHEMLYQHGAILFRGFAVYAVGDFSKVVESFGWEEHPYEGAANRVKRGHRVFTANEAPLNEFIPFHHEMALIRDSCKKVFFHCATPASEGGETAILRSDIVVRQMEEAVPEAVKQLRTLGIMPVQHTKNADKSGDDEAPVPGRKLWHRLLKTDDEEEARKRAMEKLPCTSVRFNEDGTVDFVYGPLNPIREYNGHEVMFNTLLGFESSERDLIIYHGDGSPLPAEVAETYRRTLEDNAVDVAWEKGDVLLVDNLRVQHARRPGKPPRSVMVSVCK